MDCYSEPWKEELAKRGFRAWPAFTDYGIVYGFDTVLLKVEGEPVGQDAARRDRLVALLAVVAGASPHADAVLQVEAAERDWLRGDKAVAAIRLAFAPVAKLVDREAAYRLFLAEQALGASLDPATVLREFDLDGVVELSKYSRDQPRVPAGSGRTSGQFGSKPGTDSTETGADSDSGRSPARSGREVNPQLAFLDTHHTGTVEPPDAPLFETTHHFRNPDLKEEPLDPLPFPLPLVPFFYPSPETKTKDEEAGPDCPVMRPDRPSSNNAAGQLEEFRLSLLVNPSAPTPKRTPALPDVTSMAYYFMTGDGNQQVALDDCKRTSEPSVIPEIRKGDVVEGKTKGAVELALKSFPNNQAADQYDKQFGNQYKALQFEGKGRRLLQCVGSEANAIILREKYNQLRFPNARFLFCP